MPNMKNIITSHNKKLLSVNDDMKEKGCNCRGGVSVCPLDGKCLTESLVYQATVTSGSGSSGEKKSNYLGLASTSFKDRYYNHTTSFRV